MERIRRHSEHTGTNCRRRPARVQPGDPIVRRARPADARALAELFEVVGPNQGQGSSDAARWPATPGNVQVVAEEDGRLLSSMATVYHPWNESCELGPVMIHPAAARRGLGALVMQRVVDDMCAEAAGDVFFSCPRVRSALNLCAGLEPPMIVAGHDVGRTVVDGARETHLITVSIPARAGFVHVTPPVAETAGGAFIRKRVYRPLRLPLAPGEYPPESFVGVTSEWSLEWGSVVVDYDPGSPNQALEIVASRARCAPPDELLRDIDRLCRAFPHVQHITATVLADKTDLLRRLTEFGFEVSAYLPAWYKGGVYRYDCVQLVKRGYGEAPVSRGLDDILNRLEPEIGSILTPARAAGRADRVARHRRS